MTNTSNKVCVDVYSDFACPWCYVGKAHLDAALTEIQSTQPDIDVEVVWHPYRIDKRTKPEGEEYLAYNQRRWGGDGWTIDLRNAGKRCGLQFANWKTWPNTINSHTMMVLAMSQGGRKVANQCKDMIFEAIYEKGANVSLPQTLGKLGEQLGLCGVEESVMKKHLREQVLQEDTFAKEGLHISGVPHFIICRAGETSRLESLNGAVPAHKLVAAIVGTARRSEK